MKINSKLSLTACALILALGSGQALSSMQDPSQQQQVNIEQEKLSDALLELAQKLSVQILFTPELIESKTSKSISGNYTIEQALTQLLDGSGLTFTKSASSTYVIKRATTKALSSADKVMMRQLGIDSGDNEADSEIYERIEVVGSNIRGAKSAGTLPVSFLNEEDIANIGAATGDELMRSIPQMGEISFNNERQVGGVNDARGDVASINLRGVGTGNTLTLLNGRRLVLHPGTQAEDFVPVVTVNTNTLPVRGLSRVEVLRDGAAAIYGTDAVAGVVNYVLKDDLEGSTISVDYGSSVGTELDQFNISASSGFYFNDDKSHLSLSLSYFDRSGMPASDREYAANNDRREYPGLPESFVGDTQLDNRDTGTPWGEFSSASLGTFHIQPDTLSGCVQDLGGGLCVDQGGLGREQRFNRASVDSMTSDVSRLNLFAYLTHELNADMTFFSEALFYSADSERIRAQNDNLTAQRFTISADAAFNPFGEDVTLRGYLPVDAGNRVVSVDDTSYRFLVGLRGVYANAWDWESAIVYSKAETEDNTANRIDARLFQQAINQTDPNLAYNVFTGGDINNLTQGDTTLNPQSVIDTFTTNIIRYNDTELASVDFKVSNPELASWYAGDIGMAAGVEYRYESFSEERDPLLNGSIPFIDQITGRTLSESSALGSSDTPSAAGSRNVLSAYAEFLVPLHDTLEMQLALRHERYNDAGNVTKPKVAVSWVPQDWFQLRGAYSEGFRAPNLAQTSTPFVSRSNTRFDPVTDRSYGVTERRAGNPNLEPENSENLSYGMVFTPIDNLMFTVDWWNIEQTDLVGIVNSATWLAYDAILRDQGGSAVEVVRGDDLEVLYIDNSYQNLGKREMSGIDFMVDYQLSTDLGKFKFTANAAKLNKFDQLADEISTFVLDDQASGNSVVQDIAIAGVGDLIRQNGRPEWRGFAALNWSKDQWLAGIRYNYVSDFVDTSTANSDGEPLPIDEFTTLDAYLGFRFQTEQFGKSRVRFGVRNLTDEEPPIADESYGYFSNVHSNRGRYVYINLSSSF